MQHSFLKGTVTVLLLLLVTSLAGGTDNGSPSSPAGIANGPSVPNLINFQGRLTDASGNPVADGSHTINYTIWNLPTGGSTLWTENTSQSTSSGLFTHNLGSVTALPEELFQTYDSLYLQVQADGQTILPRIRLTSTPYTRVSNNLETNNTFNLGALGFETYPWGRFSSYGDDGQEQIRLWGNAWGEIFLHDADVDNDLTVILTASGNQFGVGGGALWLQNDAGSTTISLEGGTTGDASVVLPSSAINAGEMSNEPGVSFTLVSPDFFPLSSGNISYVVDSVDITIPASGYVEVTCGGTIAQEHTTGTNTNVWMNCGKTRAVVDLTAFQWAYVPSVEATGLRAFPASTTRLFAETAGTKRYYLNVRYVSGSSASTRFELGYIRATYYPTLYGSVSLAHTSANPTPDHLGGIPFEGTQALPAGVPQIITMEDHNARLEAEVAKVKAELEARLQKIEQQLNKTKQAGVEE